jgi:hypothetical protein
MDLEDTVGAQRDYIKELEFDLEELRGRLHAANEYALRLQHELERLNAYSTGLQKALFAQHVDREDR